MAATAVENDAQTLMGLAESHACYRHPLFERLKHSELSRTQACALLRNYDAHASVLRRLLLNAATIMPEPAVGFILENVRNEYGNGDFARNHRLQLIDLAMQSGVSMEDFKAAEIQPGIKRFIAAATAMYKGINEHSLSKAAIAAGAITATELLAIKEFRYLQMAFAKLGLEHHIWFHHVTIEEEHSDESLQLALYFCERGKAQAVHFGVNGVLDANIHLYDGLLESIESAH